MSAQLLRGAQLPAGMGLATVLPDMDFETYSEAGIVWNDDEEKWVGPPGAPKNKKGIFVVGTATYAAHPTTEVLCLSYDLKDGFGKRFWRPGLPPPVDLFAYLAARGLIEAHHVMFERLIWEHVCVARMGWPAIDPLQYRCSAAKARAFALPGGLGEAGRVMGLQIQKDAGGKRLLDKFSVPRKPTKHDPRRRVLPMWSDDPSVLVLQHAMRGEDVRGLKPKAWRDLREDTKNLGSYNLTDIASEAELSLRCPDLEGEELRWWQVDQACNHRGMAVDVAGLQDCAAVIDQVLRRYNGELALLTGVDSASKGEQLIGFLRGQGLHLESLDEEAVDGALDRTDLTPLARRVLEIRAACASASVKKVYAMLNQVSPDGRLRCLYIYHGARTGRDTGDGPQPTNLPSGGPDLFQCKSCGQHFGLHQLTCPFCGKFIEPGQKPAEWTPVAAEQALQQLKQRSMAHVEATYGTALPVISGCLRSLYWADEGRDLISSDYSSIEAVGLAMISGEQWRIDVFRSHGKIYEKSAAMMFGITFEEMMHTFGYTDDEMAQPEWWVEPPAKPGKHHKLRKKGKIGELAFGYQGWLGAAKAFGMPGTDDEIKADILKWRDASPAVVHLWGGQERRKRWDRWPELFGVEGAFIDAATNPGKECKVLRLDGSDTGISYLMRGQLMFCRLPSGRYLHYHAVQLEPSDRGAGWAISYEGWNTNPKNGPKGWIRMRTWGGRLVENLIQAICRDLLRFACINLEDSGYPVVMRTYDEIVAEVPAGTKSTQEFEQIMCARPQWASEWPVRAPGAWRKRRYGKWA